MAPCGSPKQQVLNTSNYIFQLWLCLHAIIREEIPSWPKMMILHVLKNLNENDWIIFMHYHATTSNLLILINFFKSFTPKTKVEEKFIFWQEITYHNIRIVNAYLFFFNNFTVKGWYPSSALFLNCYTHICQVCCMIGTKWFMLSEYISLQLPPFLLPPPCPSEA